MKRILLSFKVLLATMLLLAGGNVWATEVTLDYSQKGYENKESLDGVPVTVDGVTIQLDKNTASTAPAYYTTGTAARVYPGGTITVKTTTNEKIEAIKLNAVQGATSKGTTTLTASAGSLTDDLAWAGKESSVVFTAAGKGHLRITSIVVTLSEDNATVKSPKADLAAGTYFGTQSVTLSCETEGAAIQYTTDGTEPTASSTTYTEAITISETTTIKAIAIRGEEQSSVLTRSYTIGKSYATIAELVAGAQSGDQAQLTLTDAVVTYVNGSDVFVQDASGAIEFYKITSIGETELTAGSKLSGTAVVTYKLYNQLPEITAIEGDVTVTEGEVPTATAMSVADALKAENLCKYIAIKSATVTEDGIVSGKDTLAIFDKWSTGITVNPGLYDQIIGVASTYNGTAKLNFISADTTTLATVTEGTYYLQNVATKQYFCGANNWGTHASINASGIDVTLARQADGTYTIDSKLAQGDNHYLSDVWCDGAATGHGFYAVEGAENTYYIATTGGYLAYDGSTTSLIASATQDENAQWVLVTKEDRIAELQKASKDNPINATFLIEDPNFGRNDTRSSAWTMVASNQNLSGGNNENNCAESYHAVFTLSQKIGLPAGVYAMTAQGFYRQDGSDNDNLPVFFIGDSTATFPLKTGTENSMPDASVSFSAGNYTIDPIYFESTGDSVLIGAKLETNTNLWCIWDNFQLTYYGTEVTVEELENAALYAQLDTLIKEAKELLADETLLTSKKEGLAEAIAAGEAATAETLQSAVDSLTAAIATPKAYKGYGEVLAKMKALTESTNVYTEEALNEYYTQWQAKYDEGTLTDEEGKALEDPTAKLSWHASNKVDDFLMSAWNKNVDDWGSFHINTWSEEAENGDGTEFYRPFVEYWVASGALSADTISATISKLAPGEYTVSAVVRVQQASATPTGITMEANDSSVSVCEGTFYSSTNVYVDTVSVTTVVGADSTLTISFNVGADTNVGWFSFKNVKYAASAEEPDTMYFTVNHEEYAGVAFSNNTEIFDVEAIKNFLGIDDITTAEQYIMNATDGSFVDNTTDGWRNAAGDATAWGSLDAGSVCVKIDDPASGSINYIGCYDTTHEVGDEYHAYWAFVANEKVAIVDVAISFVEIPVLNPDIVKTITVNVEETEATSFSGQTANFDVDEVIDALGAASIDDCDQYIVNCSNDSLVINTTDGWRNAAGDATAWGSLDAGSVCVKIDDPASGSINYIGCYDTTHKAGDTYTAKWCFVYNNQAVVINVVITFVTPTGIQGVENGESLKNATIYTLGGQRVSNVSKGGIYIINGKKVLVK